MMTMKDIQPCECSDMTENSHVLHVYVTVPLSKGIQHTHGDTVWLALQTQGTRL